MAGTSIALSLTPIDKRCGNEVTVIQECYLTEGLERAFRTIHEERMVGLPILNPALQVQAVGFRLWNAHSTGILITPWLMNLLVLPSEDERFNDAEAGDKRRFDFPSGPCDMTLCDEELLGRYLSRPLFSPMGHFADQLQAVARAELIMEKLMTAPQPTQHEPPPEPARRALLRGLFSAGQG